MTSPIYNKTSFNIERLRDTLPHALLLDGPVGIGLLTIATHLAGKQLASIVLPTDKNGTIDTLKGSIKATQIRGLYDATKGKTLSRQIFIIDDADKMVAAAQHSFLKLLEEPAPNVHFILTSHHSNKLLATVLSRVQRHTLRRISTEESRALLTSLGVADEKQMNQLLFLASGRPAELIRLASSSGEFAERIHSITDARDLLQGDAHAKLSVIAKYQNDRQGALQLITAAQTILAHSMKNNDPRALIVTADQLATAYDRIAANGNVKLQLTTVVV